MKHVFKICEYIPFLLIGLWLLEKEINDEKHVRHSLCIKKINTNILRMFISLILAFFYIYLVVHCKCDRNAIFILVLLVWILIIYSLNCL